MIGILLAIAASMMLAELMVVPYLLNPTIKLMSFVFATGTDVLFGYVETRRAAQLNPIDALRHE